MLDPTFLIALAGAILGAASIVLHVVAPRTKNTVDDRLRDDIDEVLVFVRGGAVAKPQPAPAASVSVTTIGLLLLVVGLAASTQISCAAVKHEAALTGNAVVDCTKADKTPIIALLAELGADAITAALGGAVDWAALESKAWAQGKTTGGCAFVALVAGQPKSGARSLLGDPLPTSAELALEELRARWGGVQWLTPGGML